MALVNAALFAAGSFALLLLSSHFDPVGLSARLTMLVAVMLGFATARPILPGGGFQKVVVVAGGLAAALTYAAKVPASHAVALVAQAMMLGVFVVVSDLFTLRRSELRRLYAFVVVLVAVAVPWHVVAVWFAHVQFPRPHLQFAALGELCGAAALAFILQLAAPALGPGGRRLPPRQRVAVPDELEASPGAGGLVFPASLARDTMPPHVGEDLVLEAGSPTETQGDDDG